MTARVSASKRGPSSPPCPACAGTLQRRRRGWNLDDGPLEGAQGTDDESKVRRHAKLERREHSLAPPERKDDKEEGARQRAKGRKVS